jgi:hypothetical protein
VSPERSMASYLANKMSVQMISKKIVAKNRTAVRTIFWQELVKEYFECRIKVEQHPLAMIGKKL